MSKVLLTENTSESISPFALPKASEVGFLFADILQSVL